MLEKQPPLGENQEATNLNLRDCPGNGGRGDKIDANVFIGSHLRYGLLAH